MVNKIIHHVYWDVVGILREVGPSIVNSGTKFLSNSRPNPRYGISNREIFGLAVVFCLRKFIEPDKVWFINTESHISDDGIVGYFKSKEDQLKVEYVEIIEQVYLPGIHLERDSEESATEYLARHTLKIKGKGLAYEQSKSLFVFSDVSTRDPFYWAEFVKEFYSKTSFLHLYFIGLSRRSKGSNRYHLVSFTNQKHRLYLNGEFEFRLTKKGIDKFKQTSDLSKVFKKSDIRTKGGVSDRQEGLLPK